MFLARPLLKAHKGQIFLHIFTRHYTCIHTHIFALGPVFHTYIALQLLLDIDTLCHTPLLAAFVHDLL